jgi:hypothetical protein
MSLDKDSVKDRFPVENRRNNIKNIFSVGNSIDVSPKDKINSIEPKGGFGLNSRPLRAKSRT